MRITVERHCLCSICDKPNDTYEQYHACLRQHQLERWMADPEMRQAVDGCREMLERRA